MIKRFRSFKNKLCTKDKDCFCIEGTHLIEEFLKSGFHPDKIIATESWLKKNKRLVSGYDLSLISQVSKEALASAVSTKNPDGVAALVERTSMRNFNYKKEDDFILILDRIQDPGNLGNLFRTALAAGVNKVLLAGGAHPLNQKVLRASCGSIFHLPFKRFEGSDEEICDEFEKDDAYGYMYLCITRLGPDSYKWDFSTCHEKPCSSSNNRLTYSLTGGTNYDD